MKLCHSRAVRVLIAVILLFLDLCFAQQEKPESQKKETARSSDALNVNWLYGAYVPREVPLVSLTNRERLALYLRQTYITPGIYLKTGLFAAGDELTNTPPEWDGFAGFVQRFGSRYGQFAIQNSFSAAGNLALGYEPRYERCRCSGVRPRLTHAFTRNFVTYNRTEQERRPQIALYSAAMGAGMISSTWKPGGDSVWVEGYQAMLTQAVFGVLSNVVGEFAPDIKRLLRKNRKLNELRD